MSTSSAPGSFSNVVSLLRFPLILLVVAIHAVALELRFPEGNTLYIYISELLSHGIARIAVPLFFFFSGYYTFYHKDWSLPTVWRKEWGKKARSLLLPYLLWNTLYILILLGKTHLTIYLGGSPKDPFVITDLGQLASYYWADVIVYPLWYIRDLLSLTLLAPLGSLLLRLSKGWVLLLFGTLYLIGFSWTIASLSILPVFFFLLGGWMGQRSFDPLPRLYPLRYLLGALSLVTVLPLPFLSASPYHAQIEALYILTGGATALLLGQALLKHRPQIAHKLQQAECYVFFVYAVHTVLLVNWARGIVYRIPFLREDAPGALLGYFLLIALTLGFSLFLYALLRRLAPRVLSVLCGGR